MTSSPTHTNTPPPRDHRHGARRRRRAAALATLLAAASLLALGSGERTALADGGNRVSLEDLRSGEVLWQVAGAEASHGRSRTAKRGSPLGRRS